jgi:hypothetical protein
LAFVAAFELMTGVVASATVRKEDTDSRIATSFVLLVVAESADGIEFVNLKSKSLDTVFVSSAIEITVWDVINE